MDLRQLRYFVKIVELKSITAASNALHIAQPSLSHHIANLEVSLGVKLLIREARGVQCTPSGSVLYEHAKVVLRQAELAEHAVRFHAASLPESVTLGMPRSEGPMLAPHILEALARDFPQVHLTIVEDAPDTLADMLASQKIEVALLSDVASTVAFDALHLATESLLLIGPGESRDHSPVPLSALADVPLMLPRAPSSIRTKVDDLCRSLSIPYRVVAEAASASMTLQCVKAGICWTILPWAALVRDDLASGFHFREIEGESLRRELFACMSTNAITSPASNAVRAILIDTTRQLVQSANWRYTRLAPSLLLEDNAVAAPVPLRR